MLRLWEENSNKEGDCDERLPVADKNPDHQRECRKNSMRRKETIENKE